MGLNMSKILIVADVHLGVPNRLEDIFWSLRVTSEYAYRHGIDKIVCLGDMFHDRTALGIDVLCAAHDFFTHSKQKRGQQWITFPGNHDMYLKHSWSVNSLKVFEHLITIIDDVKILKLNDNRFWILPFIHFEGAYMRVLKKIEEQYKPGDVLLTHIGTTGAIKNVCFLLKEWGIVNFDTSKFNQVYTGHFHTMQQVGRNVWYPGSLIPFKFDEGDSQHGFFTYDLDKREHEFIDIWELGAQYFPEETPPPNYLTVPEELVGEMGVKIAKDNILRIACSKEYTRNQQREIEQSLLTLGARGVRWLNIAGEEEYEKARKTISAGESQDPFESWLAFDKNNRDGLDDKLLRQLHAGIADEADQLYSYDAED